MFINAKCDINDKVLVSMFIGWCLTGTAPLAQPLDGSVKSTISQDWGWVATRLIISTWWGCISWEKQMQSTRWIFKRDKGNKLSSSRFNTSGHPRSFPNTKTNLEALGSAAAAFHIHPGWIVAYLNVCMCYMSWMLFIIMSYLISKWNVTASRWWLPSWRLKFQLSPRFFSWLVTKVLDMLTSEGIEALLSNIVSSVQSI